MNEQPNQQSSQSTRNLWHQAFQAEWDQKMSVDSLEFDAELVAAYAEGNVTEQERLAAEHLLASNATALELLGVLSRQLVKAQHPLNANPWRDYFQSEWDRRRERDSAEFDGESIAAYAAGSLTDSERQATERVLANCPAALELLVLLRSQLAGATAPLREDASTDQPLSLESKVGFIDSPPARSRVELSDTPASTERPANSAKRTTRRVPPIALIATAASLLLALGATLWSFQQKSANIALSRQNSALARQTEFQALALAASKQEFIATTESNGVPLYSAGATTPSYLELAMSSGTLARGVENDRPAELEAATQVALTSAKSQVLQWRDTSREAVSTGVLVALASLEISINQMDEALSTIQRLADLLGESASEVQNLRAVHLLAQAENQPLSQAEETVLQAKQILDALTSSHPEFATGWLNLALLLQRHEGPLASETRVAWDRYLSVESREELREVVRQQLSKGTSE